MPYQDMIIEAAGAALERTPDKQRIGRFSVRVLGSPAGEMKPEEAVPVSYDEGKRLIRRRAITVIRAEAGNSLDAAK